MKQDVKMPRGLLTFLRWICPEELIETIEGDVIEQFEFDVQRVGASRARWRALVHTLDLSGRASFPDETKGDQSDP